ncbi:TIR domain-containing protein [Microbacterium sp. APC 3901]|uniref:TIR domain-containing protein n=1 Tax=Microbacterium sp. APC 3901 TaxID=3035192 RepID=UPI0025B2EA13|nr:TIR domain-containing protein [Microbacterium sp. APC 3901]MDN3443394.1 nucleotide-binding protein [Microbacterium sp. APC 3901]
MDKYSLSTPGRITVEFVREVLALAREAFALPITVGYSAAGAGFETEVMFGDEEQLLRIAARDLVSFRIQISDDRALNGYITVSLRAGVVTVASQAFEPVEGEEVVHDLLERVPAPHEPPNGGLSAAILPEPLPTMKVFIGHGGDDKWQTVRDIVAAAGYRTESFERDTRNGTHILGTVLDMVRSSDVAIIVMTGADSVDGHPRARENVVHELGVAHAALGPRNTVIMLEEGISEPSNISGTDQLRFANGDIYSSKDRLLFVLQTLDHERAQ